MEKNILELKINNKNKDLDKYLKPQWSWKTLVTVVLFCSVVCGTRAAVLKKLP